MISFSISQICHLLHRSYNATRKTLRYSNQYAHRIMMI